MHGSSMPAARLRPETARRVTTWALVAALLTACGAALAQPTPVVHSVESAALGPNDQKPQLLGDRFEYWADDLNGQFYALFEAPKAAEGAAKPALGVAIRVLREGDAQPVAEHAAPGIATHKVRFLVSTAALPVGKYQAVAALVDAAGNPVGQPLSFAFVRSDRRNPVVRIPTEGVPIQVEDQAFLANAVWPMRAGVPLPINAVPDPSKLALFENGAPVPTQVEPVAVWCPKGSAQWVHLDFLARYANGKAADYRLRLLDAPPPAATPLKCVETDDTITVDTGAVRFEVNRKRFAGIETAWCDSTGQGKYDAENPVIKGPGGPYLVDGRMIRFDAANDAKASVVVEKKGPVSVTIAASGWYVNPEGRVDPMCQFKTRITAYAGQPMLRISQHTVITYDTRQQRLADVGFRIAANTADGFLLGADGANQQGPLPAGQATVFLHQDRHDHFRLLGAGPKPVEGKVSDGWFSLTSAKEGGTDVTVALRDIWQKFPKEVEMGRDGFTVHFWPKHGRRAFTLEDELKIGNIYKFWCFHQGTLLDLNLPNDYFEKFAQDYAAGTFECRPEHALNGNGEGLAIGNEFALFFSPALLREDLPKQGGMFQRDPAALAAPEWNAATGSLGRMAAKDRGGFAWVEEMVEQSFLSHTRAMERGQEYGMWNYADTHTYWNARENRAELHRVWHNSHYHEMGMPWMMYYRSGSPDLLRWARACTDHWMNVDTVNYASTIADAQGNRRYAFKYHTPGAMYHCKGLTHWGNEVFGMMRRDGHAGLWGHWVDPDAFLWCWYLSGDRRAKDVYDLWSDSIRTAGAMLTGTRREANTSFAYTATYYQATWDADILPSLHGLGLGLRTLEPLEKQHPGPMWHPLWINRYFDLTRDPEYVEFIKKYGRMTVLENTWTTALGALAYEVSGDATYLTQHARSFLTFPRKMYHAKGDPYDWYGIGPGPLGEGWGLYLAWGRFLRALQDAKITELKLTGTVEGNYLVTPSRYDYAPTPASLTVYGLKSKDGPFTVTYRASSLGGDLHRGQVQVFSPSGKKVMQFEAPPVGGPSSWTEQKEAPADGETGLYRFELRLHAANVRSPVFSLPHEAALAPKGREILTSGCFAVLRPTDETAAVDLTITSPATAGRAANVRLEDGAGATLIEASLFAARDKPTAAITLDPAKHPLPWKLDVVGHVNIKWDGKSDRLFMATSDESLKAVMAALK